MSTTVTSRSWHAPADEHDSEDTCISDASIFGDEACSNLRADTATSLTFDLVKIVSGSVSLQGQLSISPTGIARPPWTHLCGLPCSNQQDCLTPASGSTQNMEVENGIRPCHTPVGASPRTPVGLCSQGVKWLSSQGCLEFAPVVGRGVHLLHPPKAANGFAYCGAS